MEEQPRGSDRTSPEALCEIGPDVTDLTATPNGGGDMCSTTGSASGADFRQGRTR